MFIVFLIGGLIALTIFVLGQTAFFLLPWTIAAFLMGAVTGVWLGKLLGWSKTSVRNISVAGTAFLVVAFGYLCAWLDPPLATGHKGGLTGISQQTLDSHFVIHIGVTACLGAITVSRRLPLLNERLEGDKGDSPISQSQRRKR